MKFEVPILLILFNRPNCTKRLMDAIVEIKPQNLYIAIDGPRIECISDVENIAIQRNMLKSLIDWDCNIHYNFSATNQGVKYGPFNAIKWFFGLVDRGIVLEDDCIPDISFFPYCKEMLERYATDSRVGLISGRNDSKYWGSQDSYDFSTSGSIWGWASWARVIQNYEVSNIQYLKNIRENIYSFTHDRLQSNRLSYHLKWAILENYIIKTWDYQLHAYLKLNFHLYIIPKVNLIQNVGFGEDASHTKSIEKRSKLKSNNLGFPLVHPNWITPNSNLSKRIYRADSNSRFIWWYLVIRFHLQELFK